MNREAAIYLGTITRVASGTPGEVEPPANVRYDWVARSQLNQNDTISGVDELPHRVNEGVDVRVADVGSPVIAAFVGERKVFSLIFAETTPHDECDGGG